MYIASVYPITITPKSIRTPLSYFIKENVLPGAIVEITIQKKKIIALIGTIEPLVKQKLQIKNQGFALKKIQRIISPTPPFHPSLLKIANTLASYYRESPGSILKTLAPVALYNLPHDDRQLHHQTSTVFGYTSHETVIGTLEERLQHYKTIARETFAKNKTLVIITPTVALAEYYFLQFQDIPKKSLLIHGSLTTKKLELNIQATRSTPSPSLIIGTPILLGVLNGAEHIIIVDDADSPHYFRHEQPRIDMRKAIELFADEIQAKYIEGKNIISIHDLKNNISPHYLSSRVDTKRPPILIDISGEPYQSLSTTAQTLIAETEKSIILFINRKGFYSFVMCLDCGHTVYCENCGAPLTLHAQGKRGYICHHCQKQYPPDMPCRHCSGWNLKGFGTGSDQVYEEIKKLLPYREVWQFDEDRVKTLAQRASIAKAFHASRDGILIGTELVLEDPSLMAALVIVINLDNLFSIPDYGIHERMLGTLAKLEEKSLEQSIYIQTRFPKHALYQHFARHSFKEFLSRELEERKENDFPPYAIFIRITLEHKNATERNRMLENSLLYFEKLGITALSYPSFTQSAQHHILISIKESVWVKNAESLKEALNQFPFPADIVVDPPSIL